MSLQKYTSRHGLSTMNADTHRRLHSAAHPVTTPPVYEADGITVWSRVGGGQSVGEGEEVNEVKAKKEGMGET